MGRRILKVFSRLRLDRRAATAIEYGLLAGLIAIAAVGAMNGFGGGLKNMWDYVANEVVAATS